jgi:hypothetical protein
MSDRATHLYASLLAQLRKRLAEEQVLRAKLLAEASESNRSIIKQAEDQKIHRMTNQVAEISKLIKASARDSKTKAVRSGSGVRLRLIEQKKSRDEYWLILPSSAIDRFEHEGLEILIRSGEIGFGGTVIGRSAGERFSVAGDGRALQDIQCEILEII